MQSSLDPRLVRVTININNKTTIFNQPLFITANGTLYANSLQDECDVTILNLDRHTQDYILSETSPYNPNKTAKIITVEAGRESYGYTTIYTGNIAYALLSQPPDTGIILKCLTGNFLKGNIITRNQPGQTTLKQITSQIAADLNAVLNFQATDKNITNYQYSGSALKQIDFVAGLGGVNIFLNNGTLIIKNAWVPLTGVTRILNASTGLLGIPVFTEQGVKCTFFIDNKTTIGAGIDLQSNIYPAVNGLYVIYKLGFQISTRETPFYYIAEAARMTNS